MLEICWESYILKLEWMFRYCLLRAIPTRDDDVRPCNKLFHGYLWYTLPEHQCNNYVLRNDRRNTKLCPQCAPTADLTLHDSWFSLVNSHQFVNVAYHPIPTERIYKFHASLAPPTTCADMHSITDASLNQELHILVEQALDPSTNMRHPQSRT